MVKKDVGISDFYIAVERLFEKQKKKKLIETFIAFIIRTKKTARSIECNFLDIITLYITLILAC